MPRSLCFFALTAALALTGCNPASKLVGKWQMDVAAPAPSSDNPLAAMMTQGMASMFQLDIEFKADGICSATGTILGKQMAKQGKWKYVKSDGDALVLSVEMDGETKEVRAKFKDDDHVEMVPPSMTEGAPSTQSFPFKRVKTS